MYVSERAWVRVCRSVLNNIENIALEGFTAAAASASATTPPPQSDIVPFFATTDLDRMQLCLLVARLWVYEDEAQNMDPMYIRTISVHPILAYTIHLVQ